MNRVYRVVAVTCALLVCADLCRTQELAHTKTDNGFSSKRLERVTQFFQGEVDKKAIPGATVVIARNEKAGPYRRALRELVYGAMVN